MWELLQPYSTQLVAAALAGILTLTAYLLQPRVKLVWGLSHGYAHAVNVQSPGGQNTPLLVHTATHLIANLGRKTATQVEVTFNYPPGSFEVWPQRQFSVSNNPNGRFVVHFDSLAPKERLSLNLLVVGVDAPPLLSVRCNEAAGKQIPLAPMRLYPKPILASADMTSVTNWRASSSAQSA
jgi:hypothetical protein